MSEELALLGGEPVRKKPWPVWPRADENTEKLLRDVLYSGRWTISGCYTGKKPYERRFAEAFAEFHSVPYCVPTANGSSALKIALQALDIGYGSEVLVPGLTWVACASSVLDVGATPVLVDIDPESLCMSLEEAKKAITKNTAAIMLVHLYSRIADLEGFIKLSKKTEIPIIEDCSQAHGAMWKGQRVGTFGEIGVFSMQQSKVLTCGEGGAALTRDKGLHKKMQQFRADGRLYGETPVDIGQMELEELGAVRGGNYCMSEFHAAILLDRLKHLDEENRLRVRRASYLYSILREDDVVTPLLPSAQTGIPVYYQYCVRLSLSHFGDYSIDDIAEMLTAELNLLVKPVYSPLNDNILYPSPVVADSSTGKRSGRLSITKNHELPVAKKAREECLTFPHNVLLDDRNGLHSIPNALSKITRCS